MLKVVLVDDEQMILNGLKRAFPWAQYGCEVAATAEDGLLGVQTVRRVRPDILLTDIRMPNMDGLKMIAALKSEFPDLQIAVLTAFRDFEYAQQAIRLGVTRYLLKPSKMDELQEAIAFMAGRCAPPPAAPRAEGAPDAAEEASSYVVQAAMEYIRAHYTEHIHLGEVADNIYVSQWHLSKLINKHLGQSFFDIVNQLRVEKARELLGEPSLRVGEIAELVGFSDVAHFSKTFKKITGLSPVEYRQKT